MNDEILLNCIYEIFMYENTITLNASYLFESLGEIEYQYLILNHKKLTTFLKLHSNYFELQFTDKKSDVKLIKKLKNNMNDEDLLTHVRDIFSYTKEKKLTLKYINDALGFIEYNYMKQKHMNLTNFFKKNTQQFELTDSNTCVKFLNLVEKETNNRKNSETIEVIKEEKNELTPKFLNFIKKNVPVEWERVEKVLELLKKFDNGEFLSSYKKGKRLKFFKDHPEVFELIHDDNPKVSASFVKLNGFFAKSEIVNIKMSPKIEEKILDSPKYIYSIDFELISSHEDVYIPLEIGCVKSRLKDGKIIDTFQRFINVQIEKLEPAMYSAAIYTEKKIHGIPFKEMDLLVQQSLKSIMNDFLVFIEYDPKEVSILYAKGKLTEIKTFEAISKELNIELNLKVIDVLELVQSLSDLNKKQATYVERQAIRFLKQQNKCLYHQRIDELFHCALDDAMANALLIEEGIKHSFKKFLDLEPISRASLLAKKEIEIEIMEIEQKIETISISQLKIDNEEVKKLINILPESYLKFFDNENIGDLIDIEMDLNRIPKAHFYEKKNIRISDDFITQKDIDYVIDNFNILPNNRSGIEGCLHRISVIRGVSNEIVGITLRVGKPIIGICEVISDILDEKKSILFLGSPGSGKTSFIRDIARYISKNSRTIIVDSSSEISGFGGIPHESVGDARIMKIPENKNQQHIMIEAIQNHTPDCLIIDEIGTQFEVNATKECSQRGIILYASAHGNVENLEKNQTVVGLVGGIESVIMSDKNMGSSKQKIQRRSKYKPLFDVIVEFNKDDRNMWNIYKDVEKFMNQMFSGEDYEVEIRRYNEEKSQLEISKEIRKPIKLKHE